jgi:hypothetical protein
MLPHASKRAISGLTAYGMSSPYPLTRMGDAVEDAKHIAQAAGRSEVTEADVKRAVTEYRIPSDNAQVRSSEPAAKAKRRSNAAGVQVNFKGPETGRSSLSVESTTDRSNTPVRIVESSQLVDV